MKQSPPPSADDDMALALTALAWILSDEARAERFLALTGLTPVALRGALESPRDAGGDPVIPDRARK